MPILSFVVGFVRTIAIILLFYVAILIIRRYIWPWLMQIFARKASDYVNKKMNDMYNAQGQPGRQNVVKDDGEVSITYTGKSEKKNSNMDGVGDYVDFEEIDE